MIRVEFYGIPKLRAGTETALVETISGQIRLGEALAILAARFPGLAGECLRGNELQPGYVASLNGKQFISDPHTAIQDGQSLLILSADAGG